MLPYFIDLHLVTWRMFSLLSGAAVEAFRGVADITDITTASFFR